MHEKSVFTVVKKYTDNVIIKSIIYFKIKQCIYNARLWYLGYKYTEFILSV
jgi:hypothetical protein